MLERERSSAGGERGGARGGKVRVDQGKRGTKDGPAGAENWSQPVRHLVDFRQCGN